MTLCVIDGKQCQCQPDEGVACTFGTPAEVQAAMWDEVMRLRKDAERYRWLRDVGDETWTPLGKRPGVNFTHEIDQSIDAAIARARGVGAA